MWRKLRVLVFVVGIVLVLAGCTVSDSGVMVVKTADPNLSIAFQLPMAEVVPAEEVGEVVPDPVPVPPCEVVKGNISRSGEKIYHVSGGANYSQVKIDEAAGEMFFCSEEEAQAAGWRKALR